MYRVNRANQSPRRLLLAGAGCRRNLGSPAQGEKCLLTSPFIELQKPEAGLRACLERSRGGPPRPEGFSHEGSSLTRNGGTMSALANPVFPRTDHSSRPTSFALDRASRLPCALTKNASLGALECAFTKSLDLKSPGINTCKKDGGGGTPPKDTPEPLSLCRSNCRAALGRVSIRLF